MPFTSPEFETAHVCASGQWLHMAVCETDTDLPANVGALKSRGREHSPGPCEALGSIPSATESPSLKSIVSFCLALLCRTRVSYTQTVSTSVQERFCSVEAAGGRRRKHGKVGQVSPHLTCPLVLGEN